MKATNLALDIMGLMPVGAILPAENALAQKVGVSRTAMRSALLNLENAGLIGRRGRQILVRRRPRAGDYFAAAQTESKAGLVERRFLEMAVSGDLMPGRNFSEAELARRIGASTVSVREFLFGFSRHGLVEKTPGRGWRLCAFDEAFARELASTRRTFELSAVRTFAEAAPGDPVWVEIADLAEMHRTLSKQDDTKVRQFPSLDRAFHRALVARLRNRFVESLYDVVSFVFHYHYQWRKDDEVERYRTAIAEHILVLDALLARDIPAAEARLTEHLETSVRTLLQSPIGVGRG
jgi:DNA-binding GntR family transcriptional regulator